MEDGGWTNAALASSFVYRRSSRTLQPLLPLHTSRHLNLLIRRCCAVAMAGALLLMAVALPVVRGSPSPVIFYDGSLNTGTPDTQGCLYLAQPAPPPLEATQSFAAGVTTLTTTLQKTDKAGYFYLSPPFTPTLDSATGYTVYVTVELVAEDHAGSDKDGDGIG